MASDHPTKAPPPAQNSGETALTPETRGRPFEPGKSGNPGGRPSTRWIREFLSQAASKSGSGTRREALIQALFLTAIDRRHKDHTDAAKALLAYDVGKPIQAVELSGPDGGPIEEDITAMTSEQQNARFLALLAKAVVPVAEGDGDKPEG